MTAVNSSLAKSEALPPDESLLAETLNAKLPFRAQFAGLTALAGDASNRRYFRIHLAEGRKQSIILMQLADPEAFKQSEEAVSGTTVRITELPFVNILKHLARAEVPVPALYYYDQAAGLVYLEDFGDVTLTEACRDASAAEITRLYRTAIDALVSIHTKATSPADPACLAFHRSFDVPLLMWEFDHFLEYGLDARTTKPMSENDRQLVRAEFQKIAGVMASQPRVLTHRDYHSRNLMVNGKGVGVLDFQDALLGPATYDLASLLRDAYIELEEPLIEELIDYYLGQAPAEWAIGADRVAFRRLFDLTSIQRNLKAAGRFVYIDRVKRNPNFLADIPRTLGYVRRNLAKYAELRALRTHLTPYVPEWQ